MLATGCPWCPWWRLIVSIMKHSFIPTPASFICSLTLNISCLPHYVSHSLKLVLESIYLYLGLSICLSNCMPAHSSPERSRGQKKQGRKANQCHSFLVGESTLFLPRCSIFCLCKPRESPPEWHYVLQACIIHDWLDITARTERH